MLHMSDIMNLALNSKNIPKYYIFYKWWHYVTILPNIHLWCHDLQYVTVSGFFLYVKQQEVKVSSAAPGTLQYTVEERVAMYKTALQNAKTAGETSKARRYDRGLKVGGTTAWWGCTYVSRPQI